MTSAKQRNTPETIAKSESSSQGPRKEVTYPVCITPDPHFFGRENMLGEMQSSLSKSRGDGWPPSVALVGTPGAGKTSLAKCYLDRSRPDYDYLFLVSAESRPKLTQDFSDICRLLGLAADGEDDAHVLAKDLVLDYLIKSGAVALLPVCSAEEG